MNDNKYLEVIKELAPSYFQSYDPIDAYVESQWTDIFCIKMMLAHKHPPEVTVIYNSVDINDPDYFQFVFKFKDVLYSFYYFMNSDTFKEVCENSLKTVTAVEKVVTVYE